MTWRAALRLFLFGTTMKNKLLWIFFYIPYFAVYNAHPCFWPKLSGKKIFHFNFLIQYVIYLYLETKPVIIFQGMILHMDVYIAL